MIDLFYRHITTKVFLSTSSLIALINYSFTLRLFVNQLHFQKTYLEVKILRLLLLLIPFFLGAQNSTTPYVIKGQLLEHETNYPLEYATVSVTKVDSKEIIDGTISDQNGFFKIELPQGIYDLTFEYLSFKTLKKENVNLTHDLNLGTIKLSMDFEALENVEIIAENTTVEIKLDKKIYNVGKDLTLRGGSVSDVLDNVPSISVDIEGNVALRGNQSVRILINGKPSGLVGLNSTEALRQLPAEAIEKVEVITSPSARYDAEGTAGILNIILRRSKLLGLNGSMIVNTGYPERLGGSANLNYRTGDLNWFTNAGYNTQSSPGDASTETEYFNTTYDNNGVLIEDLPNTYRNEYRDFERRRIGYNINSGVEWYMSPTASLTASVISRSSNNENNTTNKAFRLDDSGTILSQSIRKAPETEVDNNTQFSLNFDKQFHGNSEHRLTFDFQTEESSEDEQAIIYNDGIVSERVKTIEQQKRTQIQSDFTLPLENKGAFELGYNGRFIRNNTDYSLEFFEDNNFVLDTNVSNTLEYKEYVNALYAQYGAQLNSKLTFLLGLRMEATAIEIYQYNTNDRQNKDYIGLFPTINLGYKISEDQSITLGYNRRISRPRSRFLNPFPSRTSATNLFQGNPDIDPSYSQGIDLGYLNKMDKLTLNSSIYFNSATDVFTFVSEDTGDEVIIDGETVPIIRRGPINLAEQDRFGFEMTTNYSPTKQWNLNLNFNLFQAIIRGNYKGLSYDSENLSWFIRLNNKLTLPWNIQWQTRLFYSGPTQDAINKRRGVFSSSMGFSKDLFGEKASIAINVNDLFNSQRRYLESTTPTFFTDAFYRRRFRSIRASFTYRFNQKKQKTPNKNIFGSEDEGF